MARGADGRFVAGIDLTLQDAVTGPLRRILAQFSQFAEVGKKAAGAFKLSANLKQSAEGVKTFTDGVSSALKEPVKKFMDFEKQMSSVKSALFSGEDTVETRAAMASVSAEARRLGAETKFSATEAAEGIDILAKNFKDGPGKTTAVLAAMPGILDLAAASSESIATSSDIASAAMNQFGLQASDMGRIGDVLVKTANSSATGITDIGEALKNSAVAAAGAGITLEKTTALIGALGNAGVKGGEAGTALRAMILRLQAPNAKAKSALDFLGVNTKDKSGNLRPIEDLLAEIGKKADKKFGADKNGNRRAALMKGLFEDEAFAAANILTAQAGSGELAKVIESNYSAAGTAAKTAKEMSNNAAGASAEFDSTLEELQLTIGEALIPSVTELFKQAKEVVTQLTGWAKENPELVKGIADVAKYVVIAGGGIWALTTAAGAATTAWGVLSTAWAAASVGGGVLTTTLNMMKMALLANPVTAIAVGLAAAAILIYENWEPISGFFSGVWEGITSGAKAAFDWILDKIKWVGEAIEEFTISVMTEDQAKAYAKAKEAESKALAKESSLFEDDLGYDPNSQTKGKAAFGFKEDPTIASRAVEAASGFASKFADPNWKAQQQAKMDALTPSATAPLMPPAPSTTGGKGSEQNGSFSGDLKITIDNEGKVKGTTLKTKGAPFGVKVNTGAQ
jgi:TP901 family phage tail tape measure protein